MKLLLREILVNLQRKHLPAQEQQYLYSLNMNFTRERQR